MTTHANAVRKHAQPFVATLRKAGAALDHFEPHRLSWQDLCRVERDAKATAHEIIANVTDGTPEARAAEIEAAFDALTEIAEDCGADKDARTARGDRGPWAGVDLDRRPTFENKSSPAVDGGDNAALEPFALRSGQPMRQWACARSNDEGITPGAFLRAIISGARNEAEQRALSGGTDAAGGFTVPSVTSAQLIDLARANMVLDAAGAQTMPLDSAENIVAKVTADPTPAWRIENAAVNESDPTFGGVILKPKSIAVMVKASVELMTDSLNLETELPNVLAKAMAQEIDRAGLIGSGTDPEPKGIVNYSGLTSNTYAGGALANYGPIMTARGALHGANERLGAVIMASRDENTLASLNATDGQPLNMPQALQGVPMLHTTAIPTDGGAGSDESQIIAGDFTQLLIGFRSSIRVEILRERFMDNLQFGLIAHARVDFAAARESAFTVLDGVTA
ncbi:phage major capsid protein [Thalassobacter stenotrophicus]|uniref:phage major capsid protein n=1 Tax=Thalassobacter stenotrophicus TaxID=266809 RepID=UPI000D5C6002|nr:phage major capsid protein [Thalassobacter stenotrophicus]PVZ47916.1 phage major capsid protein [Thalassobacter stenotrophicus]